MRSRIRMVVVGAFIGGLLFARIVDAGDSAVASPRSPADFREVIQRAKDRVFPALVHVRCIRETRERGKRETVQVGGSGVLISRDGEFLTNWHVVRNAVDVRCLLFDGRAFSARVVGTDQDTDLGVCRIEAPADTTFPWAELGDSKALVEGDFVMAMGAPWGMSRSVSLGMLSCARRYLTDHSEYSLWLQTDAAISPGNSGGPLVNTEGRVVGINARGVMRGGDMGFAIPSSTIAQVLDPIRKHGRVPWAWTGLRLQPLQDFSRNMYFGGTRGVIVTGTDPDSPARETGIQPNDRIVSVGGTPVTAQMSEDLPALRRMLALLSPGSPVKLDIQRGEEHLEISITPREKGRTEGEELDLPRWGFSVKQINRFASPSLHAHRKHGLFVHGVKRPGNARDAGLRENDILLRIGKAEIATLDDLRTQHTKALKNLKDRSWVLITVLRGGLMRQVVLDFGRDYE
ncbi:MAG: trypsin-like peptidase domain-containing protein, partial [Candidatus Eisenbacteria bacterium]|nr:trypsin-like peptidase domain-containing protein [Candidatus Eisenbacteria bacterium]